MNMKLLIAFALTIAVSLAAPSDDHYDAKYDDFDIDTLVSNKRLLKAYAECFLGTGNCTPDGTRFKKIIPEAIETTCARCTSKQKGHVRKMINALKEETPSEWTELLKSYDSESKYRASLDKFLSE